MLAPGQKPLVGTQINWGHPLSKGLVGAWVINEGSGDRIYDASGNQNDLSSIGSPQRNGGNLEFNGSSDGMLNLDSFSGLNSERGTVAFRVMPLAYPAATAQGFWEIGNGTGVTERIVFYNSADDRLFMFSPDDGNFWGRNNGASAIPADKWSSVVATYVAGEKSTVFINRELITPDNTNNNLTQQNNLDSFQIATFQAVVPAAFLNAIYEYGYMYDRVLTSEEASQLHFDPYQMFTASDATKMSPSIVLNFISNLFKAKDHAFTHQSHGGAFTFKAKDN